VGREWDHLRTTSTQPIVCGHSAASFVKMTGLTAAHRTTEILLKSCQWAGRRGRAKVTKPKQGHNQKPRQRVTRFRIRILNLFHERFVDLEAAVAYGFTNRL